MPKTRLALIVVCLLLFTTVSYAMEVKVTGYFPKGYKNKRQAIIEGGKYDRYGKELKTLQDYCYGSYVSCATDPKVIKSGTIFKIKEIPDITFLACDVGRAIKGKRLDICVNTEADTHKLPKRVTIITQGYINLRTIKYWIAEKFLLHNLIAKNK